MNPTREQSICHSLYKLDNQGGCHKGSNDKGMSIGKSQRQVQCPWQIEGTTANTLGC